MTTTPSPIGEPLTVRLASGEQVEVIQMGLPAPFRG
jgi:hypothetical protein